MANRPPVHAGIDIGSNSFRLLIAHVSNNTIIPLYKHLDTVRLGRGLADTGKLSPEAMALAFQVFTNYRNILNSFQPASVRACGTAALRRAANRNFFLELSSNILNVEIEVISGEQEAFLALRGATGLLTNVAKKPVLLVDAGGGSTELIYTTNQGVHLSTASVPLGAVSLTEAFLQSKKTSPEEFAKMADHIEATLAPFFQALNQPPSPVVHDPPLLVATGGTATALAALSMNLKTYKDSLIQGHVLLKETLKNLLSMLMKKSPAERNKLPGLGRRRGEIILGGAAILDTILKLGNAPSLTVSDAGLVEGILLSAADSSKNVFTKMQKSHIS